MLKRPGKLPAPTLAVVASGSLGSIGTSVVSLAVIWLLTGLTHSPGALGFFYMVVELPYLLLLVPAGIWADRANRRQLALALLAVRVAATCLLAWLAHLHDVAWTLIVLAVVAQEAATAILQPALSAWLYGITPAEEFGALTGWQQAGGSLANLLGPTAGGLLVSVAGIPGTIFAGALAGLPRLAAVISNRQPERPRQMDGSTGGRVEGGFQAGLRFLREHPGLLGLVLFFTATNGLNNVEAVLVPLLARIVLRMAAWQFGLLTPAFGVGGIAGSFLGMRLDARAGSHLGWAFGSMAVFRTGIVAMGIAPGAIWLGAAYFVLGLSFTVTEVVTTAIWQRLVPDEVRGRVMSTVSTLARTANPLGFLLAGWLGVTIGTRGGLLAGGIAILVLTLLVSLSRRVRMLDRHDMSDASALS